VRFEEVLAGIRAILARELIEGYGFSRKRAATALNLSQPAITLYLSGRRASASSRKLSENLIARQYINGLIEKILLKGSLSRSELYDAALSLWRILESERAESRWVELAPEREESRLSELIRSLRERVQAEQESAEEFMRAAMSLRDDLVRMIFRMIASGDCLRHADILMALISAMERRETINAEQLKRLNISKLLEKEEKAHVKSLEEVKSLLPSGLASILVELIQDDERKHSKILKKLAGLNELPPTAIQGPPKSPAGNPHKPSGLLLSHALEIDEPKSLELVRPKMDWRPL